MKDDKSLILEFLGYELIMDDPIDSPDGYYHSVDFPLHSTELEFDNNWNHLMFVVDKIETLETEFDGKFGVHISFNSCAIQDTRLRTTPENYHPAYYIECIYPTKIEATYYAVTKFIQWWNRQDKDETV